MNKILHHSIFPLAIIAVCLILQLWVAQENLRYERDLLFDGEIWRLFTANLIHLGWIHLGMNMLGLTLVYVLLGVQFSPLQWLMLTLFCGLGVSFGLLVLNPGLHWYVGFSGVLHGLLLAGITAALRAQPTVFSGLLLACVVAKLVWEQVAGALPGSVELVSAAVIVDAHLYGAIAGFIGGLALTVAASNTTPKRTAENS